MIDYRLHQPTRLRETQLRIDHASRHALRRFEIPDPVRISVALLTDFEIERMEADDLACIIELADIPPIDRRLFRSFEFHRLRDLRRLVFATRTACRDYCNRLLQQREEAPSSKE